MSQQDGEFRRKVSRFRKAIPSSDFPAEVGRYVLYLNYGCPWAHRTNIVRSLKGLEGIVELIEVDSYSQERGWFFGGKTGPTQDPYTGSKSLRELYLKVDPESLDHSIASVPVLFDKSTGKVFLDERITIYQYLPKTKADKSSLRSNCEQRKRRDYAYVLLGLRPFTPIGHHHGASNSSLLPVEKQGEIEAMNEWIYETVNNGVYRCGFATTEEAYETNLQKLYASLDRLEHHLSDPQHHPYFFGEQITEVDINLFPTIIRFDAGYSRWLTRSGPPKMIRNDFPILHDWVRRLYWDESSETNGAFKKTTSFERMAELIDRVPEMANKPPGASPGILPR